MKRSFIYSFSAFVVILISFTACAKDDYIYPSVQLQFITAQTNAEGKIISITTDKKQSYGVNKDLTTSKFDPNISKRLVANFELIPSQNNDTLVNIYSVLTPVSTEPQKPTAFTNGIKTDPADLLSIWLGSDYLNILLSVLCQIATHTYGFVEQSIETDNSGRTIVAISLYHDSNNDVKAYTKRVYLSLPLQKYMGVDKKGAIINFSLYTYSGEYKTYQFDYCPK